MIRLISIYVSVLISGALFAQAPDTLWTKTLGPGEGRSVQQTSDGGYIITGGNQVGYQGSHLILIKTDVNGTTLWTKTFGDSLRGSWGNSVQQTTDGGFIITGVTNLRGREFTLGNAWLLKTYANGDTTWTKTFRDSLESDCSGQSVQQTTDGGYVIAGDRYGNGFAGLWLIKTDADGDTLWTKNFRGSEIYSGNSVQQTTDGGYIVTGTTRPNTGGESDVLLIKTDVSGNKLWTKSYGGTDSDWGYSVQQTTDGGYIITGNTGSFGAGSYDIWLIKTDASGDTLWTKTFGGSDFEYGNSVQQTTDGGYIVTGNTGSFGAGSYDIWLIKTDASGGTLWTKTFGGSNDDWASAVQQTTDGGFIITGMTELLGANDRDIWLIKVAPDVTAIDENPPSSINDYILQQNYPNPFNPATTIRYSVKSPGFVSLVIFDILGNEITTLISERKPAGTYEVNYDAADLPSGVYLYRLKSGSFVQTKKMILIR